MFVRKVQEVCDRPMTYCVDLVSSPIWGSGAYGVCLRGCVVAWWFAVCLRTQTFLPRFVANPGPPSPENMGAVDSDADMKLILDRRAVREDFRK